MLLKLYTVVRLYVIVIEVLTTLAYLTFCYHTHTHIHTHTHKQFPCLV